MPVSIAQSHSAAIHQPAAPLRSARHLGRAPERQGKDWRLLGQDGGQTIDLGNAVLMVFSDTLLAPLAGGGWRPRMSPAPNHRDRGGYFLANCAGLALLDGENDKSVTGENDVGTGADDDSRGRRDNSEVGAPTLAEAMASLRYFSDEAGRPREVLVATPSERRAGLRFWPQHGVRLGNEVYIYYLGIRCVDPNSTWGFETAGTGLAVLDLDDGSWRRLQVSDNWCLWPKTADDFHVGVQVLKGAGQSSDGWLYVYASLRHGLESNVRLARVREAHIAEPERYEYLCDPAPRWQPGLQTALDLGPAGAEFSVSHNPYLDRYLLTYLDPYDKTLYLRSAAEPWGPFSSPQRVGQVRHNQHSELVYLGFEHPCFARDGGRTVQISYCQPHFVPNELVTLCFA